MIKIKNNYFFSILIFLKMSYFRTKLSDLFESSQLFYNSYILYFNNAISSSKFNKFRLYFLSLITEVKNFFIKKFKIGIGRIF
jgi:hypothetical protein